MAFATLAGLLALAAPTAAAPRDRAPTIDAGSFEQSAAHHSDSGERVARVAIARAIRVPFALRIDRSFARPPARVSRAPRQALSPRRRCPRLRVDSPPDH